MVGLDLALPFGAARDDKVAVHTERGDALPKNMAVEGRAAVELEAVSQTPLGDGLGEDLDRGHDVLGLRDQSRDHEASVVVDDRQHPDLNPRAVDQAHREGTLAVELPSLVGVVGLEEIAQLALLARAELLDPGISGMRVQVAAQRRAAQRVVGELDAEVDLELRQRAPRLLVQEPDRVADPCGGAGAARSPAIVTGLGQQARVTPLAVGGKPAVERAPGDRLGGGLLAALLLRLVPRSRHGLGAPLPQRGPPARLVEARVDQGGDLLEAPGGDLVGVGHLSRLLASGARDRGD